LAIDLSASIIAVGSWGCGDTAGSVLAFEGVNGNGQPVLEAHVLGQVWVVDADTSLTNGKHMWVAAGSWETEDKAFPAQCTVWTV
jgi:hypothetical protein